MRIEEDVLLGRLTTLRVGGAARFYARAETGAEVVQALEFARARRLAVFVLGGGSNLLVSDEGFEGLVVHAAIRPSIEQGEEGSDVLFDVSAGTDWDGFTRHVCGLELSGMECLAGIPGLTGGTPVQNVGAYGQEVAQTIESVSALDLRTLEMVRLSREECGFRYRQSIFNTTERGRFLVLGVRFRVSREARPGLSYGDLRRHFDGLPEPSALEVYEAVRGIRRGKGMLLEEGDPDCRSAGSFFKNPIVEAAVAERIARGLGLAVEEIPHWPAEAGKVKLAAAWLIEQAGFCKGFQMGRAGISSKHTLALVNRTGDCTCAELLALRDLIAAEVGGRFGVRLEQEPVMLGPQSATVGVEPSMR